MVLQCIIVDDEPIARKLLQEYIEEIDFLALVGTAENPLKAVELINQPGVDLIFLDVNMPKMSGFQFLRSTANLPMVIMTTAYGQYAVDGFEMAVIDYLVKPFSLERFLKATQKALELATLKQKQAVSANTGSDYFYIKCDGKIERVGYNELIYVEAMANYIILHTVSKKLVVYLTIKRIQEELPPNTFLQVHKSYIVNIDKIQSIEGHVLDLGTAQVSIGLSFYDKVIGKILNGKFYKR